MVTLFLFFLFFCFPLQSLGGRRCATSGRVTHTICCSCAAATYATSTAWARAPPGGSAASSSSGPSASAPKNATESSDLSCDGDFPFSAVMVTN